MKNHNTTEFGMETGSFKVENVELQRKMKRKWSDNFVFYIIAAAFLVLVGQLLGAIIVYLPIGIVCGANFLPSEDGLVTINITASPLLATISQYLVFIGIWIICLLWFRRKNNRYLFRVLGTSGTGNSILTFLLGFLIGAVTNGLCILGAYLHGDIYMCYDSFRPLPLLLVFISVLIQSSAEELVCRGYLYRKLLNRYNPIVAILVSSLFFSLLHIGNDGVGVISLISLLVSGLQYALMVYYFDSIWCAFATHTAWNFTQSIIFGLPNSGMVVPFSILKLDESTAANSIFYNVNFGVEGTVFSIIIETAACVLILLWGQNKIMQKERREQ